MVISYVPHVTYYVPNIIRYFQHKSSENLKMKKDHNQCVLEYPQILYLTRIKYFEMITITEDRKYGICKKKIDTKFYQLRLFFYGLKKVKNDLLDTVKFAKKNISWLLITQFIFLL